MNPFDEETYDNCDASVGSLDLDDLLEEPKQEERKLSGIVRPVFVNYGMRSVMVRMDPDESFTEVKRVVEGKTGIQWKNKFFL